MYHHNHNSPSYHSYNSPDSPNLRAPPPAQPHQQRNDFYDDTTSEIYIDSTYHGQHGGAPPPPPPRVSRLNPAPIHSSSTGPHRPVTPISMRTTNARTPSEYSSVSKTKSKTRGGVVIETMSAPNPCCPDRKGVCCILLLLNLGLLLVTLGFSIVLQLFDPPFVWYCGLLFLIVGFISLIVCLLFCMRVCQYSRFSDSHRSNSSIAGGGGAYSNREPSELYWTHHWQKRINLPSSTRNSSTPHDNSDMVFHSQQQQHRAISSSS